MKSRLGENIANEWDNEQFSSELWDALQLCERDALAGSQDLERLSRQGSALSMMFLGHALMTGRYGLEHKLNEGEYWLKESIKRGSIEARYVLAKELQANDRGREAVEQFEQLVRLGYAPAMYILGWKYYIGEFVEKDLEKAYDYFSIAHASGHLFGTLWVARILSRHCKGPLSKVRSVLIRARHIFTFVYLFANYPESDRLRR